MTERYDVIVLGIGAMGAATCQQLARRGLRVLGIEQFAIPHNRGAHHGASRLFRLAYFEHPHYVRLLQRAYDLWQQLETQSNQKLLHVTGGLYLGRPTSELVAGSLAAARQHNLPHDVFDRKQLAKRFPQFHLPDDFVGFYEQTAGFIMPQRTVSACALDALRHGATLRGCEPAIDWHATDSGVTVRTARGTYEADRLVITAGAWASRVLADLNLDLKVTRQILAWVWPRQPERFALGQFPVWALDSSKDGTFTGLHYGPPMIDDEPGFKIALHLPADETDPDHVDPSFTQADEATFRPILRDVLPDADGPLLAHCTCLYTNTPDGHFILDQHPNHRNVTLGAGFSGHGAKFIPVIGEALADLAQHGETKLPIDFLNVARFNRGVED